MYIRRHSGDPGHRIASGDESALSFGRLSDDSGFGRSLGSSLNVVSYSCEKKDLDVRSHLSLCRSLGRRLRSLSGWRALNKYSSTNCHRWQVAYLFRRRFLRGGVLSCRLRSCLNMFFVDQKPPNLKYLWGGCSFLSGLLGLGGCGILGLRCLLQASSVNPLKLTTVPEQLRQVPPRLRLARSLQPLLPKVQTQDFQKVQCMMHLNRGRCLYWSGLVGWQRLFLGLRRVCRHLRCRLSWSVLKHERLSPFNKCSGYLNWSSCSIVSRRLLGFGFLKCDAVIGRNPFFLTSAGAASSAGFSASAAGASEDRS